MSVTQHKCKIEPDNILNTIRQCARSESSTIGLHEPYFNGNEWKYVKECIDTRWVSSVGKFVDRFENDLARYTGAKHAVCVVNGTAGLTIALKLTGVKSNDEVLVPDLTFVATANAASHCKAIPHFVDSSYDTLGVDPNKLKSWLLETTDQAGGVCRNKKTGRIIRALVVVHVFGHPAELDELSRLCREFNIEFIEDASESLGSFYKGRHTGNWGKFSVLSFNGNKILTTGGGGAILTNDSDFAEKAKHITTTAKKEHAWEFYHDLAAYNFRLPNINAALGCAQLEKLPEFVSRKRELASRYKRAFSEVGGVKFFEEPKDTKSNYWLNTIILDKDQISERDNLLSVTNKNGVMTRPVWNLMHTLPMYRDCPRMDVSNAIDLEKRIINIPSSVFLS